MCVLCQQTGSSRSRRSEWVRVVEQWTRANDFAQTVCDIVVWMLLFFGKHCSWAPSRQPVSMNQADPVKPRSSDRDQRPTLLSFNVIWGLLVCLCPQSPHGLPLRHSGSPKFAVKTRQAFFLQTTSLTQLARRLCHDIIRPRYLARHPYLPVNTAAIKAECKRLFFDFRFQFNYLFLFTTFFFLFFLWWISAGALRGPEVPKKPLPLKSVERKPLESVVRYLGKKPPPTPS